MMLFAAILFAGTCAIAGGSCDEQASDMGYSKYQSVRTYFNGRSNQSTVCSVYVSDNACGKYIICYAGVIYHVKSSNNPDYGYMFYCNGTPVYFNM